MQLSLHPTAQAESQERRLPKEEAHGILPQWLQASKPDEQDAPAGSGRPFRARADGHGRPRPGRDVPAANGNVRPGANGIPRQGRLQHHGKVRAKVPRRKGEAGHRQVKEHVQCLPEVWALGWGRGLPAERGHLPRAATTRGGEVEGSKEFWGRILQKIELGNIFAEKIQYKHCHNCELCDSW